MRLYHELAMRTAPEEPPLHIENEAEDIRVLIDKLERVIDIGRQMDLLKSRMIYGKEKSPEKFDPLPANAARMYAVQAPNIDRLNKEFIHAVLGIVSEASEMAELLLWHLCGKSVDELTSHITEEQGDLDWFQELLASASGNSVDSARAANIAKLAKRYPEKFTSELAEARLDKEGEQEGSLIWFDQVK